MLGADPLVRTGIKKSVSIVDLTKPPTTTLASGLCTSAPVEVERAMKSSLDGPTDAIDLLYMAAAAIQQVQNPTPEKLASGAKAAHGLAADDYDKVPSGVTAEDWAKIRVQMPNVSRAATALSLSRPACKP
jgi:hypothetical protein